ncbi:MAG: 2-oxo acid dehydrogenase subunit E2 [Gemmatimonadota bacterium]|jgi:hypothetical protein
MRNAEHVGPHRTVPFRRERNATLDTLRWARRRFQIPILLEVDVTDTRRAVREARRRTGAGPSFTSWVVACVARAAAKHPRVHSIRRGRTRIVMFDEVDVAVLVERAVGESGTRETLPMPFVVRRADRKAPTEIHDEIRRARTEEVVPGAASLEPRAARLQSLFLRLPAPLRDLLYWRWLLRSPERIKRTMGTVVVTASGMATPGVLAWGIPSSLHPLAVGVGGIARRSTAAGDRDVLALSVVFDHAVTDGAPVGRFVHRLHELLSGADGLDPAGPAAARDPGPRACGVPRRTPPNDSGAPG